MSKRRVLIVCDGKFWFVRAVASATHDIDNDEMVYRCDRHLGGPFQRLIDATLMLKMKLHKRSKGKRGFWEWPDSQHSKKKRSSARRTAPASTRSVRAGKVARST